MIELAITGSFLLLALAFLIQMGLRMNYQQDIEQQTFRDALAIAKSEGSPSQAVVYYKTLDRIVPNPAQGFAIRPRIQTQGSATVTWAHRLTTLEEGDRDSMPRILVQLNDYRTPGKGERKEYRSEDLIDEDGQSGVRSEDRAKKPLVKNIKKTIQGSGQVLQNGLRSRLETTTSEDTALTLNVRGNNNVLRSRLDSQARYNW